MQTALSPATILGGILAVASITIIGAIESPNNVTQIIGFGSTITGVLLLMLQNAYMVKRIDQNDKKTDDVMHTVQEKGTEVKAALRVSDAKKTEQLSTIEKKLDTCVEQTNGLLTSRLDTLEQKVEQAAVKVEKIPDAVKEIIKT